MYEEIKPLQKKELLLLKELKRICEKCNITYFLVYGTLLGAVRHQGFIPWDDDIDVCMNVRDYLRFEEACKKELQEPFFLQTRNTDPNAGLSYNKLRLNNTTLIIDDMANRDMNHGINIDIYPLYNVSDNKVMRNVQIVAAGVYMLLEAQKIPVNHGKTMKALCQIVLLLVHGKGRKWLKDKCYSYMAKYERKKTKYKSLLCGNLSTCCQIYFATVFEQSINLKFEDEKFSAPIGYKEFLQSCYGDYMKLPPIEDQGVKLNHIVKLDTETSYYKFKGILYNKNGRSSQNLHT